MNRCLIGLIGAAGGLRVGLVLSAILTDPSATAIAERDQGTKPDGSREVTMKKSTARLRPPTHH
jgi:hypothetical protein